MSQKLLTKDYIKYKSILNELTNIKTDYYEIITAFIENGNILISGYLKPNLSKSEKFKMLPEKYRPRTTIYGSTGCGYSMGDIAKLGYVRIDVSGNFDFWIDNLSGNESFSIQYPLRID